MVNVRYRELDYDPKNGWAKAAHEKGELVRGVAFGHRLYRAGAANDSF